MSYTSYNAPAPNTPYYTPAQYPPAGTAIEEEKEIPRIFQPLTIRGVTFQNRIWLSPLCQYSADDGKVTAWHMAHLGGILTRGPGFALTEATAVSPEGRITPEDAGIWNDEQMLTWKPIVDFAHSQNQKIGIQLGHAGRKASTVAPWVHRGHVALEYAGGWPDGIVAPSPIAHSDGLPVPRELTKEGIQGVVAAFAAAARRALQVGFDVLEVHAAYGFLIHEFLSPVSNKREDEYGGSFENRVRLLLELVDILRAVMPPSMPLFVRLSASDGLEETLVDEPSWRVDDTIRLVDILAEHGVDLIDISNGGIHPGQNLKLQANPGYQVVFSEAVRKQHGDKTHVSAVGMIETGSLAEHIVSSGKADAVFVGRAFLKNPGLVWAWAEELDIHITLAHQIEWGCAGRPGIAHRRPGDQA